MGLTPPLGVGAGGGFVGGLGVGDIEGVGGLPVTGTLVGGRSIGVGASVLGAAGIAHACLQCTAPKTRILWKVKSLSYVRDFISDDTAN